MIDINELRINDVIFNKEDKVNCSVCIIDAHIGVNTVYVYDSQSEDEYSYPKDYYDPILITEELLLKLGFIKEEDSISHDFEFKKWIDGYPITVNDLSNTKDRDYSVHIDNRDYETILGADIQYLHQLQNAIYFATKHELDAKNIIK